MPLNLLKATHFNFKSIYRLTTFPKISILKLEKFSSVIRTPEVCWASDWEGIINNWLLTGGLRAFKAISLQLTNTSSGPVSGSLGSPSQPLERPLAVSLKHQTDKWIIRVVPPWHPPAWIISDFNLSTIFDRKYLIIIQRSADVSFLINDSNNYELVLVTGQN